MYSPSLQAAQTHACKAAQEAALRHFGALWLQYGQREAEPAQSEDGALFCGECDGELPGGCPEQYRMDCLDRRASFARSAYERAQSQRDYAMFM